MNMRRHIILLICLLAPFGMYAKSKKKVTTTSSAYLAYIDMYKDMAIQQMRKYQIPASITLAQGLLESRAGLSTLAKQSNNHFGIKVTSDWSGGYVLADDDAPNEKFRKYKRVADSYEDHSLFLLRHPRYSPLFKLSITDYKGWARTLKKCGYATDPHYAESLIRIIEQYDLTQYDKGGKKSKKNKNLNVNTYDNEDDFYAAHQMGRCNGNYYLIVKPGDNLKQMAKMMGKKVSKLRSYNDLPKDVEVYEGDIIYLSEKKSKAAKYMKGVPHIVEPDETMHSISQKYGIKLANLYKINGLGPDYYLQVGDVLYVY